MDFLHQNLAKRVELERIIGYNFHNPLICYRAFQVQMIGPSCEHNRSLEILGEALLNAYLCKEWYRGKPYIERRYHNSGQERQVTNLRN